MHLQGIKRPEGSSIKLRVPGHLTAFQAFCKSKELVFRRLSSSKNQLLLKKILPPLI